MPSSRYSVIMPSPQLSVRSARARDLAHELSRREKRPIHAIVEDALTDYAKRHPADSPQAFLKRLRINAVDANTMAEVEAAIESNRKPHHGIEF